MWRPLLFDTNNCSKDEFQVTDLREENAELRNQIAHLYQQILTQGNSPTVKMNDIMSQNYSDCLSAKEDDETSFDRIDGLERELAGHKAHIKELAKVAKDLEKDLQIKEEKLLKLNLETVQNIPLKMRINELKKLLDEQSQTIQNLRANELNFNEQIEQLQSTIDKQKDRIQVYEEDLAKLTLKCGTLEEGLIFACQICLLIKQCLLG